jgi:putative sterol carrier protein
MRSFLRFNSRYAGCKIDEERKKYPSLMYWDYVVLEFCEESQLDSLEKKYINEYPNALNIMLLQKPKKEKKNRIKIRKGKRQNEKLELNFQSLYKIYKKKLDYVLNGENGCFGKESLKHLIDIIHNEANKIEYNLSGLCELNNEWFIYDKVCVKVDDLVWDKLIGNSFNLSVLHVGVANIYDRNFKKPLEIRFKEETIDLSTYIFLSSFDKKELYVNTLFFFLTRKYII